MKGMTLSLLSGFLAALASLCGKFSMAGGETSSVCQVVFSHWLSGPSAHYICENLITVIRVVFFFLMIACNAVMWTVFTKALRLCTTTLEAAVTNTASNFFFTVHFQVSVPVSVTITILGSSTSLLRAHCHSGWLFSARRCLVSSSHFSGGSELG
ncbi:uncharacterized protein LOC119177092 isoform X1 [Rhipicephalus microplus]|uniref:uncharacterized protein LOC119177092 isoform X1 n=1 Tax=Rhipicephalus microplus TaxID=6941 RepID=UPI001888DEBC|nr:uncharacterized protein LOC119177092 isoform X1 [Rhipicephalus microplus]